MKRKIYRRLIISCDGGAASGKTTGARLIAKKYKLKFLSSGMLYRYASYLILKKKPKNIILFLKKEFKNLNLNKLKKLDLNTQVISEYSQVVPIESSLPCCQLTLPARQSVLCISA